ncbi:MAG TPA: phosphotransferase, partial [Acidimicrobiia bacterium]|nr:phosphotransferase [Acidimicrobiia bacterium]
MDVLTDGSTRIVLRRYGPWSRDREVDVAARETRALELLQRANIPAPAPIWVDSDGVFDEQAILISFVEGAPDLTPSNPFEWAEQLASVLIRIHDVRLEESDLDIFPPGAGEEIRKIQENPEMVLEHPLGEDLLRRRVMLGSREVDSAQVFSHT